MSSGIASVSVVKAQLPYVATPGPSVGLSSLRFSVSGLTYSNAVILDEPR